ncbi:MAG: ATP-dependent helicase RecQ (modular protein), partial [Armatimonadetes bacterium]|nr:ATP-dependent helicase RecQ (modular protein) [Armatimonadota bacterium]
SEFRPLQPEIIRAVLAGHDCLGVMPTGAGKSLCYQIPALLLPGLTVVVSPLLSLMQDQIDQLREVGAPAVTLNSTLTGQAYAAALRSVRSGEAKMLYVAPETLVREEIRLLLQESRVSCLTVDEAHCISEWGHDFRPEYRRIREIRAGCPGAVCLALTATATGRVQNDIRTTLGIPAETTFVAGFDRPNLFLEVEPRTNVAHQVEQVLAAHPDESGIVYCSTRDQVDTLVTQLAKKGIRALPYHAGLPDATRRENQRLFQRDEVPVIVATIAFGMGINKPNVRFIAHHSLPDCLETYYQQVGRAGRDGLRSDCILFFSRGDVGTIHHFIEQSAPAERPGKIARLQAMLRYAGATGCRRQPLLSYFDDTPPEPPCGMCDNCLAEADGRERVDVSQDARLFLECMVQTGQRFGRAHLVDVLRGSNSARIVKFRHDQIPTHGQGRHRSEETWRLLADRFIENGIVEAESERGTLRLTAASRAVLDGEPVLVILEEPKAPSAAGQPTGHDAVLFDTLRKLRKRLADEAGVPPYVIFSDRSLIEMAATYPQTQGEFFRVHGVGERRAETYGTPFLAAIREHIEQHGMKEFSFSPTNAPQPQPVRGKRAEEVSTAYLSGRSIAELQEEWGVTRDTIVGHLVTFLRTGGSLEPQRLLAECELPPETRDGVLAAFERLGDERLGPVFAEFKGAVPYAELHLLRAYRMCLPRGPGMME